MAGDAVLAVEGVCVRYGKDRQVLRDLSLAVRKGERVALLAPSGTGKTTLFRAITGFAPIVGGRIEVDGIDVRSARGARLRLLRSRVGYVSQRHDLVDRLRVHQNVMAGALGRWSSLRALRFLLRPTPEEMATAEAALAQVGLTGKLRQPTSALSGGEHQRVAIARALVQDPVLTLADEPVASLDRRLGEQIVGLLCDLATQRQTALLCSLHQVHLAEKFFERIIELGEEQLGGGATVIADRPPISAQAVIAENI